MEVIDLVESRVGWLYAIMDDGSEILAEWILGNLKVGSKLCKGIVDDFYYVMN